MREISAALITENVKHACIEACNLLPDDVTAALERAREIEQSPSGRDVIDQLIENARIAREESVPICQDTGFALVFVELGQDAHVVGPSTSSAIRQAQDAPSTGSGCVLMDAINEGVREGYQEGYLRKSIVRHPLERVNTGDNTPAVIHLEIVLGDRIRIVVAPKGGGSENMSVARVLKPSDGLAGVKQFVVETVREAGPNPCPPVVVGVGLGGTLEKAAILSKKAALRKIGEAAADPLNARIEAELLTAVNETGVGPSGLGGVVTALAVHVESYPCHIASLPVAITIQCHAARHSTFEI